MKHVVPCLLFLLLAVGCGQPAPTQLSQARDGLTAVLSMTPAAPAAMKPVVLLLTLRDSDGRAVNDAEVACDLTMPGMAMPDNKPKLSAEGDGRYRAETVFTMSGAWRVEASVSRPSGETVFTFDFEIP